MNYTDRLLQELEYWKEFVKTERFLTGWCSQSKTPELRKEAYNFIDEYLLKNPDAKVLDVGSGVVSILNGTIPRDQLTCTDPLGSFFPDLFKYKSYRIDPPFSFSAEDLPFLEEFDIVHMSNALHLTDHPIKAINKMYDACKIGGYIIIHGFEREGDFYLPAILDTINKNNVLLSHTSIPDMSNDDKIFEMKGIAHDPGQIERNYYTWIARK